MKGGRGLARIAIVGALGCPKSEPPVTGLATPIAGEVAVGVTLDALQGPAPLTISVRAVNDAGVTVASTTPVRIDVAGEERTVSLDAQGFGTTTLDEPGAVRLTTGDTSAVAYVLPRGFDLPTLGDAWLAPDAARATWATRGGRLVSTGSALFEVRGHQEPSVIFRTSEVDEIRGVQAGDLDLDGVQDALLWTTERVIALRGHAGGGYSWAKGWRATRALVAAATIGDANGDANPDVLIAWTSDGEQLEVLHGDGLGTWTTAGLIPLAAPATSLTVSDADRDDRAEITVVESSGTWERFAGLSRSYAPTGPSLSALELLPGTVIQPSSDMNGDGADDLYLFGPRSPGAPRNVYVLDLYGTNIQYLSRQHTAAWLDLADATGDQRTDLWSLDQDGALRILSWATNPPDEWNVANLPSDGPISAGDLDDDGTADLFKAGPTYWESWSGGYIGDAGARTWRPAPTAFTTVTTRQTRFALADVDGDPATVDWIGTVDRDGVTWLRAWSMLPGTRSVTEHWRLRLSPSDTQAPVEVRDLAVCDDLAWLIAGGQLWRVSFSALGHAHTARPSGALSVACAAGLEDREAAVLVAGQIQWMNAQMDVVESLVGYGEARQLAASAYGGTPAVATCNGARCDVLWWAEQRRFVAADARGVRLLDPEEDLAPIEATWLSASDLDGDGRADLAAVTEDGRLVVVPRLPADDARPVVWRTGRVPAGSAGFADFDGDDRRDLWIVDADGRLVVSDPPSAAPAPIDTGRGLDTAR